MKIEQVINYLNERFPSSIASDFDEGRIGLIIGDSKIELKKILLTLDLNDAVIKEAIFNGVNLIICHHPYLFSPLSKIIFSSPKGEVLKKMFEHQISLFVIHTNLDVGKNGVNDVLANLIGIKTIKNDHTELYNKDMFLRFGEINPISLGNFAKNVKEKFQLSGVRVAGNLDKIINTVGIVGGSGEDELIYAIKHKLDCYITSEIKLHNAQYALENNVALIEVNHGIERFVFNQLQSNLINNLNLKNEVLISKIETDPFITI